MFSQSVAIDLRSIYALRSKGLRVVGENGLLMRDGERFFCLHTSSTNSGCAWTFRVHLAQ